MRVVNGPCGTPAWGRWERSGEAWGRRGPRGGCREVRGLWGGCRQLRRREGAGSLGEGVAGVGHADPGQEERGARGRACLSPPAAWGRSGCLGRRSGTSQDPAPKSCALLCLFLTHREVFAFCGGNPLQVPSSSWYQFSCAAGRSYSYTFAASHAAPSCCALVSYTRAALTVLIFFF